MLNSGINHLYVDTHYGTFNGADFYRSNPSFYYKTLNTFTFKKGWSAELTFIYNYITIDGFNTYQPVYALQAGISKRFLNDRLIIKVSCSDILKSNIDIDILQYQDVNIRDYAYGDNQVFRLGITWKFGKSEYKKEETENIAPVGKIKGAN